MIALSTSWLPSEAPTVEEALRRGRRAGFTAFEIGAKGLMPPPEVLAGLARTLGLTFTSVHNIAYRQDLSEDESMGDSLASPDKAARARAVEGTIRTIELARAIGARGVVIHAGNVPIRDKRKRFAHTRALVEAGRINEARAFVAGCMEERNTLAGPFVERTAKSLLEVLDRAGDFPLGLECRIHFYSIPLPDEVQFIIDALPGYNIYYWHDVGHAVIGEKLGLTRATSWLERFKGRTLGFHLHDVKGIKDHLLPGDGDVDFPALLAYMNTNTIKVLEIHGRYDISSLASAARRLETLGIG